MTCGTCWKIPSLQRSSWCWTRYHPVDSQCYRTQVPQGPPSTDNKLTQYVHTSHLHPSLHELWRYITSRTTHTHGSGPKHTIPSTRTSRHCLRRNWWPGYHRRNGRSFPYPASKINIAFLLFQKKQAFNRGLTYWISRPANEQAWGNFRQHFRQAQLEMRQTGAITVQEAINHTQLMKLVSQGVQNVL